ncbi:multicopper oxidase family protein [Demequina capsici]|uniref:Multicopper oxidase family protein n=1 Tax=Demequina capsici TaxID=3075620 RepID=A0AA96F5X8_9MICO|nr:multicopper oxidase family protein [Demequina sp. OYTSA14]WNM23929.1 multicopper oxidase family protein [Demequina sp. OYTSA14]
MPSGERQEFTRRQALGWGLAGVGMLTVGTVGFATGAGRNSAAVDSASDEAPTGAQWAEPAVIESIDGVLDLDLSVAETEVAIAGTTARMMTYNGTVPGPTLHVRPGDVLRIRLVNGLDEATNLHTHGLAVSSSGASDNPFRSIGAGEAFDYVIEIPSDHPHGVAWYHPHLHGSVANQVFAGLYGAIVVDQDDWSGGAPRVVVVSDVTLDGDSVAETSAYERQLGRVGQTLLTNGLAAPELGIAPGAQERLLVVNACASRYLDLDGLDLVVRGLDTNGLATPIQMSSLVLPPGARADLLVTAPAARTDLVARGYESSNGGMMMSSVVDLTDATVLTVIPDDSATAPATPGEATVPIDLSGATIARTRTLTFTMSMGAMMGGGSDASFLIDGEAFDPTRVDQQVQLGTVEEWTLVNATMMDHPFHLHIWPMQVMGADGVVHRDVVDVPAGASVKVRIAFERFADTTVYHCHILDHEDLGMMGVIQAT